METKEVVSLKMTKSERPDKLDVITPLKPEKLKKSALDVSNMVGPTRTKSLSDGDLASPAEPAGKPLDLTSYSTIVSASQLKSVYPYSAMLPAAVAGYSYSDPALSATSGAASYAGYPALVNYPLVENSGSSQSLSSLRLSALFASRRRRAASVTDLKALEEPSRKKVKPVPDEKKDGAYWERRRKNNDAAKRSRDARRMKEEEIAIRAVYLEQDNMKLRAEVSILKSELARLHYMVYNC